MPEISNMKGKAAVVTGVVGEIGKWTALKLAQAGADIFLVDADAAALEVSADAVRALGVKAVSHVSDLDGAAQCRAVIEAAVSAYGRLDALCNVATIFRPARVQDMSEEDWDATMSMNISAPFFLIQAALPHLIKTEGAIVSVASCGAFMAAPLTAAYTASKAALVQMTKVLSKELQDTPIRINCIAPGSMSVNAGGKNKIADNVDMSRVQRLSRGLLDPADVAAMTAFLASDAAVGFHGACITMDNGLSLG
jgi:NAD(P)-dependent dehydrogenase (short-subunit alcohol dehydrogenase family)